MAELVGCLRREGFSIAIDDFVRGCSSLASLHSYPIDTLKVDRAFIRDAANRADHAAVLQAIVTLADNLGMEVVAEGIEHSDQFALLQALGCTRAQRFFFARPMPARQVPEWLDSWQRRLAA